VVWISFLTLRESTDRQTSCLLKTTHTHTVRLYDRPTQCIVQSIFNVIRFDNRYNRITYYNLRLHCFTRKRNRFNCRLQQTPQNTSALIPEKKWSSTNKHITPHPFLKQGSTCAATVLTSLHKHGTFHIAFKLWNKHFWYTSAEKSFLQFWHLPFIKLLLICTI
jgi:hypothetical protein